MVQHKESHTVLVCACLVQLFSDSNGSCGTLNGRVGNAVKKNEWWANNPHLIEEIRMKEKGNSWMIVIAQLRRCVPFPM